LLRTQREMTVFGIAVRGDDLHVHGVIAKTLSRQ